MKAVGHHGIGSDPSTTPSSMMQAIVRDKYGSADVMRLAQVNTPEVSANEVLLQVHAAGLERGAWHLMTGKPYLLRLGVGLRRPRKRVLGREVAGTIVAVGSAVTTLKTGEDVYGISRGSLAEYTVARADKLARKPANTTFEQAAIVPISGLTALQTLTDIGRIEPGQSVLIIGASGGVGSYAVQIAKAFGARGTGVCSTANLELVRSLGADHVIDYTQDDFADGAHRYDLIIDLAGNPALSRLRRALAPTGTGVIAGGENGGNLTGGMNRQLRALVLTMFGRQRMALALCKERATDLERPTDLIEAGKITPTLDRTYALSETPDAMRYLEAGKVRGKVAITI
jgi:NADPH:quinone reductase-like Zn-dependent oxidoreductase